MFSGDTDTSDEKDLENCSEKYLLVKLIQLKFVEIRCSKQCFHGRTCLVLLWSTLTGTHSLRGSLPLEILCAGDPSATPETAPHLWIRSQKASESILLSK